MKKNQLKRELGRIRPREELITLTIAKVNEQKAREEKKIFSPMFNKGIRLASALCAFALVFCIGFAVARQQNINPATRTIGELEVTEAGSNGISMLSLENELPNGWILVKGENLSISFLELADADKADGAIRRCKVGFNIPDNGLIDRSDMISVDLNKMNAECEADIVFYDEEMMNSFFNQSMSDMLFRLTPDINGEWLIVDFTAFE